LRNAVGIYSKFIFPRLMDMVMAHPTFSHYRAELLADVQGKVLEIGFGSGLNIPHYPNDIHEITTVDINPGMNSLAEKRLKDYSIVVDHQVLNGEELPMANDSFDTVVCTWTLCSIQNVDQAMREIYRVLKSGGRFYFLEHGLSDEPNVQCWQNRLNPLQKIFADGCHLNRDIKKIIEKQNFRNLQIETFYMEDFPKTHSYSTKGMATK